MNKSHSFSRWIYISKKKNKKKLDKEEGSERKAPKKLKRKYYSNAIIKHHVYHKYYSSIWVVWVREKKYNCNRPSKLIFSIY